VPKSNIFNNIISKVTHTVGNTSSLMVLVYIGSAVMIFLSVTYLIYVQCKRRKERRKILSDGYNSVVKLKNGVSYFNDSVSDADTTDLDNNQ
jgi:hypothetical protein